MDKKQLHTLITNSDEISQTAIEQVDSMIEKYPWFQTLRTLQLKHSKKTQSEKFQSQLQNSALFITDRTHLYHYLNGVPTAQLANKIRLVNQENQHFFEVAATPQPKEELELDIQLENSGYILDYIEDEQDLSVLASEINQNAHAKEAEQEVENTKQGSLIDAFIKANPEFRPSPEKTTDNSDLSTDSTQENDELITDTLAKIYIRQGLYQKAIQAFQKLSLKFPEKNTYFGDQIEEIKKLIEK